MSTQSLEDAAPRTGLARSLERLARGEPQDLSGLLHDVEVHTTIDGSRVVCHCHALKVDGNGRPRVRDLVRAICDHVVDFAIPRSEIAAAKQEMVRSGSSAKFVRLNTEARRLFTDLTQTGEGGELLLFVLAERLLRLPQLLCKMDLKTNTRMHVHGADGLHAGIDEKTERLALYWGESKIFDDPMDAIRECLRSIGPMLREDENGPAAADRDFQLLQRYRDLDDPTLEAAFKQFLDVNGEAYNAVEFRGLCLVGFDCAAYSGSSDPITLDAIVKKIASLLPRWKQQILRRLKAETLEAFAIHFICVPFPSAEDFRRRLLKELDIVKPDSTATEQPESAVPVTTPQSAMRRASPSLEARKRSARAPKGRG